jgi:hypothetical protein
LKPRFIAYLAVLTLLVSLIAASAASPAIAGSGVTRQIALAGTGSPIAGEFTPDGSADQLEFPEQEEEATPDAFNGTIDRSLSKGSGSAIVAATAKKAKSNPTVQASFEGLNFYQQRYARGGNQFSVEPPDQAMCVGNGYVVEAVNDVLNVFNYAGVSQLPDNTSTNIVSGFPRNVNHAVDLNSFYGYAPAINRATGVRGQFVTDPSCYYDVQTQRFYVVVLTLEVVPTSGAFTLENHIDIAVSATSNPTGLWKIYKIDVTGDGTHNTAANACPCLGDYPHIGADAYGFYVTTNAYPWNGNGFNGAQIYAFSKRQLASGAASVSMTHIDTWAAVNVGTGETPSINQPGFTVWPAQSPGTTSYELAAAGTEYFLSSNAADEATHPVAGTGGNYISNKIVLWALTNTASLDSVPSLGFSNAVLAVGQYAIAGRAEQPGSGSAPTTASPQGYCLNDETTVTVFSSQPGCWRGLVTAAAHARGPEVVSRLDSNDTRMQQVMYANGKVWGALDTAVSFDTNPANNKAGVAWYIVKPDVSTGSVSGTVALTGTAGVPGKNIIYPAIGVTPSGRGVVALTLVGSTNFPSAAYASIDAQTGMGDVQIVAAGAATQDGFTSYKQQVGNPPRTRWGDYGAAAVDGNSIWIASEYIAHACDYTTWGGPFFDGGTGDNLLGTCAGPSHGPGPRAALGNWSTRISKLTP